MVFYAVIVMLATQGDGQYLLFPMRTLDHCRATAIVLRSRQDERIADAQCAAFILDKPDEQTKLQQ